MKVYLYFLKSDVNNVYAYTLDKEFSKRFEKERNMDTFIKKKCQMNDYECMSFQAKNNFARLQPDNLSDGNDDFSILMTTYESTALDESCTYILSTIDSLLPKIREYPLKNKYLKTIAEITSKIIMVEDNQKPTLQVLNINTLKLFCHLFNLSTNESREDDDMFSIH